MHPLVRPATLQDVRHVAEKMRPEDVAEVWAAGGHSPQEALEGGWRTSEECFAFVPEGTAVFIFGILPHPLWRNKVGVVWMLGTPELPDYSVMFIRHSVPVIRKLCKNYGAITNFVDERNSMHIRWLKWAGFHFIARHPHFGHEGRPFLEFVRLSHV